MRKGATLSWMKLFIGGYIAFIVGIYFVQLAESQIAGLLFFPFMLLIWVLWGITAYANGNYLETRKFRKHSRTGNGTYCKCRE